jgi:outer membrane protein insertion porin family/translocation and assembly module TamA
MCPRSLFLAALLAAGSLTPLSPLAAQRRDDEIERPEIRKLELKGVKAVEKDELEESIATQESGCRSFLVSWICPFWKGDAVYNHEFLDPQEFRKDVLRIKVFYWKRGFRETGVDTSVTPRNADKVRVLFAITEGPPTLVQRVEVLRPPELLPDRAMRRHVLVRAGEPFNTFSLDTTLLRLRQAMWQRGFADVKIEQRTAVDTATRQAVIAIAVDPGARSTVGDVHVHGRKRVSERSIRNSLSFKSGEVFRLDELLRSQRALYESGLFRRAALFVVQPGERVPCAAFDGGLGNDEPTVPDSVRPDSVKRVEVCVEEGDLREARASAGFNTVDFFQVEGRFAHLNFFGGARRLDVQAAVGNLMAEQLNARRPFKNVYKGIADRGRYYAPTYNASVNVRQRWFQSPDNTIGAGVFASRRSAPGVFVDHGYGATSAFTREIMERANASAAYRFEITTVEAGDVYFCVNYGVCDRGTIRALRGRQRMSPVTLNTTIDRSNDPFAPTTGYRARVDLDHASAFTISDFRYNRAFAEYSVYRRMGARGTLASRVRTGLVRALASTAGATGAVGAADAEILHPRRRFYAGGSQSVRGFGENQLGPRVLTIPAATLRGVNGVRCPDSIAITQCDPNTFGVAGDTTRGRYKDTDFEPRPLGGNALVEGSVEIRAPILGGFLGGNLFGAVFVDAGWLRGRTLQGQSSAAGAVTPGFGVRYRSPVGPIRVDLGINPFLKETLPVITEEIGADDSRRLVRLTTDREFEPGRDAGTWSKLLQRLTLHLSIGEAF